MEVRKSVELYGREYIATYCISYTDTDLSWTLSFFPVLYIQYVGTYSAASVGFSLAADWMKATKGRD